MAGGWTENQYGNKKKMIKQLRSVFTLVRIPNLVIIAATQYAMRYLIMEPLLPTAEFELQFGDLQFFLLVLSTVFIAAAGYIINDYFDTRTDMINKPSRVVVGVEVGRRHAMILHAMLNIIGVGIGNLAGSFLSAQAAIPVDWVIIGISLCILVGIILFANLWESSLNSRDQ